MAKPDSGANGALRPRKTSRNGVSEGVMAEALDQSLADGFQQGHHHFFAALLRPDADAGVMPVDIFQ